MVKLTSTLREKICFFVKEERTFGLDFLSAIRGAAASVTSVSALSCGGCLLPPNRPTDRWDGPSEYQPNTVRSSERCREADIPSVSETFWHLVDVDMTASPSLKSRVTMASKWLSRETLFVVICTATCARPLRLKFNAATVCDGSALNYVVVDKLSHKEKVA